jgi:hypothetical protein
VLDVHCAADVLTTSDACAKVEYTDTVEYSLECYC